MRKWIAMLLSLLMLFSLAACGEDSGGGGGSTELPEGYDAEYTIVIDGSDSWTPFSDSSGVTFETADSGIISNSDDGKTVTFTGLAVGETTITAAYGDKTAKALVKVVKRSASGDNDKEIEKHYLTYCEPVKVYYLEYTNKYGEQVVEAYDNQNYYYENYYFVNSGGMCYELHPDGWREATDEKEWDSWLTDDAKTYEWPLSEFANMIATYDDDLGAISTEAMWDLYEQHPEKLPNQHDVTKYYLHSETAGGNLCDVYRITVGNTVYTYWVEPNTGFTLKYEEVQDGETKWSFEVITFQTDSANFDRFGIDETMK